MPTRRSSYSVKQHCVDLNRVTLMGVKNLVPSVCESLLVLVQLSPLCLRGEHFTSVFSLHIPAILQCIVYLSTFVEGYPCWCDKLDLGLGVATCVSFDATGLAAAKTQWHWHCCSLAACTRAPGLTQFVQLTPHCHHMCCWHLGWNHLQAWVCPCVPEACFPPCSTARQGGRSYSELCFPASSGLSHYIELACFLHRAAGKPFPHAATSDWFIVLKYMVHSTSTPSVSVG